MCYSPITIHGRQFECGHCLQCLKHYQDAWASRLIEETKAWNRVGLFLPVVFFTLKYRDEDVPCTYLHETPNGYDFSPVRTFDRTDAIMRVDEWSSTTRETRSAWKSRHARNLDLWRRHSDFILDGSDDNLLTRAPGPKMASFEFHSVCKKDVQDWLKRGRINLVRKYPDVFGKDVNPRLKTTWTDSHGVSQPFPGCHLTNTVKYFITSEYGPKTHRPHYHGVMFGVTYNEFKKCFADDWEKKYGSTDFSLYDPGRGSMLYVSKYCSKGGYEHPYCSKDFFYSSGKEFHSKDYESCIADFNVNIPLVQPTFHLISKGLGVRYCFDAELLRFFGVRLCPYIDGLGNTNYIVQDTDKNVILPSLGLKESYMPSSVLEIYDMVDGFRISRYAYPSESQKSKGITRGALIGESFLPADAVVNYAIENAVLSKKYERTYVKKSKSQLPHPAWHLIGHGVQEGEVKHTSITLPRYYRRWLVSPLASGLRSSAATRLYPSFDETVSRKIRPFGDSDSAVSIVNEMYDADEIRKMDTAARLRRSAQNFYLNSKL